MPPYLELRYHQHMALNIQVCKGAQRKLLFDEDTTIAFDFAQSFCPMTEVGNKRNRVAAELSAEGAKAPGEKDGYHAATIITCPASHAQCISECVQPISSTPRPVFADLHLAPLWRFLRHLSVNCDVQTPSRS